MNKKFTKTILSAAVAGLFLAGNAFAQSENGIKKYSVKNAKGEHNGVYELYVKEDGSAYIKWGGQAYNHNNKGKMAIDGIDADGSVRVVSADGASVYHVYDPDLHSALKNIKENKTFDLREQSVGNLINKISHIKESSVNVGLDKYGQLATSPEQIKERMSLQSYLASEAANSTIGLDKDGKLTEDEKNIVTPLRINDGVVTVANELEAQKGKLDAQKGELEAQKKNLGELTTRTDKIDAAAAATAAKVESRTLVGVSSDGTLTRAEGAKNTISVNDGLVALSGRTDRIDAAVGAIDGRVTRNTQSIEKNSKAIAANTRTLQQHSARLDSQQRQINENHKEMKRAAAQSAALTGLFQPYSVGKFNATAAVGGYSDQQALAVGVGYRFNEQTAAKAGVAFSDGDASWNVGVNFEF
ncbi:TPA: YadA C-terminal domain-containing protein [Escherichia coli]